MLASEVRKIAFDNSVEGEIFTVVTKMCVERARLGNYSATFKHVVGGINFIETNSFKHLVETKVQSKVLKKLRSAGYDSHIVVEEREDGSQLIELTVSWEEA